MNVQSNPAAHQKLLATAQQFLEPGELVLASALGRIDTSQSREFHSHRPTGLRGFIFEMYQFDNNVPGRYERAGILVATNKRMFFCDRILFKNSTISIPYDDITKFTADDDVTKVAANDERPWVFFIHCSVREKSFYYRMSYILKDREAESIIDQVSQRIGEARCFVGQQKLRRNLDSLMMLKNNGVITAEEFEDKKADLGLDPEFYS